MTDSTTTARCVGKHRGDPPPPLAGSLLCRWCRRRLDEALTAIVDLWPVLHELAVPAQRPPGLVARTGGIPAPGRLDVIDATDPRQSQIVHAVIGWSRIVVEDRRLSGRPVAVDDCARLLARHVDWIAAQAFADDALAELVAAAHQLRRICGDLPPAPLGACPDANPDGEVCAGPMRWDDARPGVVVCGRCGAAWGAADLPHLLRVMQPARRFPVERGWACARYGVAPGTLRQWVARGHVRSYSDEQVDLFDLLRRVADTHGGR